MGFRKFSIALGVALIWWGAPAAAAGQAADRHGAAVEGAVPVEPVGKAGETAAAGAAAVATVNGVGISRREFDRTWEYLLQRSGLPADQAGHAGGMEGFRRQVLDRLVDEELLYQESKRLNLLAGKEAVDAELEKARAQYPTAEAFAQALAQGNLSEEDVRRMLLRNLSIRGYVEQEIAPAVAVTDAEVHEFYAGNREKFEIPEQAHARHILVQVGEEADEKTRQTARAKADGLLGQLKGGASFEELARKNSDCPSASQGGDLGFFPRGQMVPSFDQAAFALKPGEISGVVETPFGYHIIKLEARKEAGLVPEPEAGGRIREYLLAQKTVAAVEQRVKALREKATIELPAKL